MRDSVDGNRDGGAVRGGIRLVPYCRLEYGWSIPDATMHALWDQIVEDGSTRVVFERLRDGGQFVQFMQAPANFPVVALDDAGTVACAWLNGVDQNSAFCHHVFMRRVWGSTTPIAGQILDYWFALGAPDHLFDVLIGATPAHLRIAKRFAMRLGFRFLEPAIPEVGGYGMWISYLERTTWEKAAAVAAVDRRPGRRLSG